MIEYLRNHVRLTRNVYVVMAIILWLGFVFWLVFIRGWILGNATTIPVEDHLFPINQRGQPMYITPNQVLIDGLCGASSFGGFSAWIVAGLFLIYRYDVPIFPKRRFRLLFPEYTGPTKPNPKQANEKARDT